MGSMHCRLYDENLVHNIILSTGLAIADFMQHHRNADADDICDYLEQNAKSIIDETIEQLNSGEDYLDKDDPSWPISPGEV